MKVIRRLDEDDLRAIVMERYDVQPSQVLAIHTEECRGYGMDEHMEPVFYIEVIENGRPL